MRLYSFNPTQKLVTNISKNLKKVKNTIDPDINDLVIFVHLIKNMFFFRSHVNNFGI